MDLDAAADALYGAPPEEFVTRRQELASQARTAKDRSLATAIGKLRRPTKSAWLVNQLSRAHPAQLGELLELGEQLRNAQGAGDGTALRRLSQRRQAAVAGLVQRAAAYAADADQPVTEAQRQEIAQTLQAALADPEATELVRRGRVVQPISYGGFGVWGSGVGGSGVGALGVGGMGGGDSPPPETAASSSAPPSAAAPPVEESAAAASGPTPEEIRSAHDAWLAARRAVDALTDQLEEARGRLAELEREREEWRTRLATVEEQRAAAEETVRTAEDARDAARREAEDRAAAYADLHAER